MDKKLSAFERLIDCLPKKLKVLDVGSGGLEGTNTTRFLMNRFDDILGICNNYKQVEIFEAQCAEQKLKAPKILREDFYTFEPKEKYDLIVLDLNIDNNIGKDWSKEGLTRIYNMLKPKGYLINYIMTTDQYGDSETPEKIRKHMNDFWYVMDNIYEAIGKRLEILPGFKFIAGMTEERRSYIYWVLLQRD